MYISLTAGSMAYIALRVALIYVIGRLQIYIIAMYKKHTCIPWNEETYLLGQFLLSWLQFHDHQVLLYSIHNLIDLACLECVDEIQYNSTQTT